MTIAEALPKNGRLDDIAVQLPVTTLSRVVDIVGRPSFAIALVVGLVLGLVVLPFGAAHELIGAAIAFGALCLAAGAGRRALALQDKVEVLQQRLLDEASYHAFVDSAIEGFFRTTRDGRYLIVNPALTRIYGYETPEQLRTELTNIGESLYIDRNRRAEFQALMARDRMVHDFVSQIRRRDGTLIWIAENARTVLDEDEQFLFYEGTVEDVTRQQESEEAMRRALAETQEAARAKAAFLAAMSHELKTPLNAVIGFSELMRQELFGPVGEPRYRGYVSDIHENGQRLLTMINDILDLSRVEGRLIDLDEQPVSPLEAVSSACDAVTAEKSAHAAITLHIPPNLPMLKTDPKRLNQILAHLISNAVKFTPSTGRIEVRAERTPEGGLSFAIADSGIGMEPDRIGHALEPFKQLDGSLSRRFEGVGLGLPLANALVRLHGGRLLIESRLGHGTTVTAEFPPERTLPGPQILLA
jgi:PAS domain S-box-containing protein